jgi:type III restriction enzyme
MFALKDFQKDAIDDLRKQFLQLWSTEGRQLPLVFKSPTGSGKTVMMSQFLRQMTNDPQFGDDVAYLWFTFSPDSYEQSKQKFREYYGGASEIDLLDLNDLNRGKLQKNNLFFINWQKIKTSTKEGRRLRGDMGEQGTSFDDFIENTHEDNRELVVIVDEAHRDTDTELADEIFELVDPRIIMRVTATPTKDITAAQLQENKAGRVAVDHDEVVRSGLIKKKIITQTKQDLEETKEEDQDNKLLELACNKRDELHEAYKDLGKDINPLVMIQLPDDHQQQVETRDRSKLDVVQDYLLSNGVDEDEIAIWLSDQKENKEGIERDDSPVKFLIFKQAPATGWDCPRASVLVMFREVGSPVFHKQTLGRILRMPEAKHYSESELNKAYLYTNYRQEDILDEYHESTDPNRPAPYHSRRKEDIEPVELLSVYLSRTDYNDLGDSFQETFIEVASNEFSLEEGEEEGNADKLSSAGLAVDEPSVSGDLIADMEISDYDNFLDDVQQASDVSGEISENDLARLYNLLCYQTISRQERKERKYGPQRSWGKLKTALNVWMEKYTNLEREKHNKVIVDDLMKENDSILLPIIGEALEEYRPIREKEVEKKAKRARDESEIEVPPLFDSFTDLYEPMDVDKCAVEPFYIQEEYAGRKNETKFLAYLDELDSVKWWYKNQDAGSDYFSIDYHDPSTSSLKLFYSDWIVRSEAGVFVFDTKAGFTAEDNAETAAKSDALQEWIADTDNIDGGGIVVRDEANGRWMVYTGDEYDFDGSFDEGWVAVSGLIA